MSDWEGAARRRGVPRIEWLCSDANPDPLSREQWRSHVTEHGEYPPVLEQAGNLAHALWDWVISGFSMASDEEKRRRMNICVICPQWDSGPNRCRLCGCSLAAKLSLKAEHCPINRW